MEHCRLRAARIAWIFLSALLAAIILPCYYLRPDAAAAVTIFPAWIWLVPGVLLLVFSIYRSPPRWYRCLIIAVGFLWLAYTVIFVEEVVSLSRTLFVHSSGSAQWETERQEGQTLRVVTLNSAAGSTDAAAEAARFEPDIVLWQESPERAQVERLAKEMFGAQAGVLVGVDASIAARGSVEARPLSRELSSYFVQARLRLVDGREIEIISLRLLTPPFRADLWSPDCWRIQREHRQIQRAQMQAIAQQIAALPPDLPVILGGDFNAPQGDAIFDLLKPRLRDSFYGSGLGWGNTITNDTPFLRIDQIWISRQFNAEAVRTYRTEYSDHRMVVSDLKWR